MLSDSDYDRLAAAIVSGHEERLVADLITQMVSALFRDGDLTVKDLRLLETVAANNRDALYVILAENRERIRKQAIAAVEEALAASDDHDTELLSSAYPTVVPASSTALFRRISQETAEGLASIIARQNLAMVANAERVWYDVAAEAIAAYNHGGRPLDSIMARSVRRLTREGIQTIDYASGVKSSTDVAVRRHVVSQVGQAAGRLTMRRLQDYGHDLVWVSGHFGARPDHAAWQGKAYSVTGQTKGYPDFYAATGYGTVTGLLGVNCRHSYGPYFPGITEIPPIEDERDGKTSEEYYELTQHQRSYERAIRQTKREIAALEVIGGDTSATRLKLGRQQAKVREFTRDNGLVRQPVREKAYGIGVQPRARRRAS